MTNARSKAYKGSGMEGPVAAWYARQTARDGEEIHQAARRIAAYLNSGSRVLEVAPWPGYLAIELARLSGAFVTGLDISRSFVGIARENARKAGVRVDFEPSHPKMGILVQEAAARIAALAKEKR